jgi:multiple sugar transport system substrate-binding protein
MATLKDVAKEAGVSIATVSCALSGAKPVRAETKARIMDAVEKLKYVPNASARNLKAASSRIIGVILPDMKSQFYAEIFDGLSACLQAEGYTINVAFSNSSPDIECSKIDEFISQNAAGLLIVTCQPQNSSFFQGHILDYQIPVIFLDRSPENLSASYIGFRNYQTAFRLTDALLKKGYRRISMICGPSSFSSERDSMQGCYDAMAALDPELKPEQICTTNMTREDAFNGYLRDFSKNRPEALIATSKEIASGAMAALEYCGLRVPENLLLFSYCEESWNHISQATGMYMTSRPAAQLGETAARELLKSIRSPALSEPVFLELEDWGVKDLPDFPPVSALRPPLSARISREQELKLLSVDAPTVRALQLLLEHFTRETGIPVTVTTVPQNRLLQIISHSVEYLTGSYDLYTYDVPWLEYMVQNLCLADITAFVESDSFQKNGLFPSSLRNCQLDGRFYGIPLIGGTQLLFYRRDLFENRELIREYQKQNRISLRPPRTWKEFNGTARFFTRSINSGSPTEYGTSFAGIIDEEMAPELLIRLWAFGGKLWDTYNRPTFDTSANRAAFESLLSTLRYVPENPFQASIPETVDDFCSGRTAMLITFSEYAQRISQELKANVLGRLGFHMVPGGHPASVGWNLGLNPFSPLREAAFRFLSWVCRRNTSFYLTVLNGASPVMAPYRNHELLKLYPWLAYTEESLANSTRRNSPYKKHALVIPQNKIEAILCQALRKTALEGISVSQALECAQEEADHLFRSYGYPVARRLPT